MGVHHAWGRTLQGRLPALQGDAAASTQRYQNGFDCQGLWVEVEVEKELGLNSKRDIEEYGLDKFAAALPGAGREVLAASMTEQSIRLGQWMDWDNSYYTMTDKNIEHIWHFLKKCHEHGWLYKGHRAMPWCTRCGTSLSQHEQAGEDNYQELDAPVALRPLSAEGAGGRVAPRLDDDAVDAARQRRGGGQPGRSSTAWPRRRAGGCAVSRPASTRRCGRHGARSSSGSSTRGPFDDLPAQAGVVHRVIPWDEVALDEGTGIVHIAPGAAPRTTSSSRARRPAGHRADRRVRAVYCHGFGWLEGPRRDEVEEPIVEELERAGPARRGRARIAHRYPICWRCKTQLVFRVVDEWFICGDEIRQPLLDANDDGRVDPAAVREADGGLAAQHGRLVHLPQALLGPAAAVLPVRVRPAERRRLARRARGARDGRARRSCRSCTGRGSTRCRSAASLRRRRCARIPEVGDGWLDAGIVPFSTLGWENPARVSSAATRPAPRRG